MMDFKDDPRMSTPEQSQAENQDSSESGSRGSISAALGLVVAAGLGFFGVQWMRNSPTARPPVPTEMVERAELSLRGDEPVMGARDAAVTIVEFFDYRCTYCAQAHAPLEAAMATLGADVRLVAKHYPLQRANGAVTAAKSAWAAHQQGAFWDIHRYLLAAGGELEGILDEVRRLGLDVEQFQADAVGPAASQIIEDDFLSGSSLGVRGTPVFFVNGRAYQGLRSRAQWIEILEHERAAARRGRVAVNVAEPPGDLEGSAKRSSSTGQRG